MANGRKEFELAFKLSAKVNGSMNNTFKTAQSAVANMQKQIQQLNRTQADISAYQKQQQAADATRKKLEVLKQQYDNIQKEIKETEGFSSDLQNKLLSKQQQIDKTTASLERQTERLDQNGEALRQAGINTENLTGESKRLEAEINELKNRQEQAADSAEEYGEKGSSAMEAISDAIAAAGVAVALKEIAAAYMECVNNAAYFEETLSSVQALSGASASEMEELADMAKRLGSETQFTAQESAEAMTYMGMAGWQASDMINGLDGVMQLAAASGEELAMVSDIVTDSLTALGLSASDSAHFSDVLAAAATNSNTNVSLMGETFKYAASMAGTLGYSAEDVAVAIGLMANSGIKGSMAGTSLSNIFSRLATNANEARDTLEGLGVEFFNANGSARDLSDVIDDLRAATANMTEQQKATIANTIAGQQAQKGLLTILNATDADYRKLTASINNCTGAAGRMAQMKLDNMNGQLKLMQSAWEGVTIAVGEQFTPAMSDLYKVGAEVFSQIKDFIEEHPALIKAAAAFVGVLGTATAGLTAFAAAAKVVQALNLAAMFTGPAGPIMLAVAGVAALTGAVIGMSEAGDDAIPTVNDLTEAAKSMSEAMDEANVSHEEARQNIAATAGVAESYISRLEEIEAATGGNTEGNIEYHNTLELLTRTVPELAENINLETSSIEGGTAALREHTEAWRLNAEAQARQDYVNSLYDEYSSVLIEAEENSIKLTSAERKERELKKQISDAQARMNQLWKEAQDEAERLNRDYGALTSADELLTQEYYDLHDALQTYNNDLTTCQLEQDALREAVEADNAAVVEAKGVITDAEAAIEEMTAAEREAAAVKQEIADEENAVTSAIAATVEIINDMSEAYSEVYNAAYDSITGQYSLWDEAAEVSARDTGKITEAIESQSKYWADYNENLKVLSERTDDIEGLSAIIASFADGSKDSVNAIAGMADASDEDLKAMVKSWEELRKEQAEASKSITELKTHFTESMDELQADLEDDIRNMDLSAEAAEAGRLTIQGYIDAASGMEADVLAAYEKLARAASGALYNAQGLPSVASPGGTWKQTGYAGGTDSAEPGFAMVGENGPEMMFMNGGEKILTASETARAKEELSAGNAAISAAATPNTTPAAISAGSTTSNNITINNSPTIVVNGNQPGDLEEKLEANNRLLLQQVDAKLNGNDDEGRTRYE